MYYGYFDCLSNSELDSLLKLLSRCGISPYDLTVYLSKTGNEYIPEEDYAQQIQNEEKAL